MRLALRGSLILTLQRGLVLTLQRSLVLSVGRSLIHRDRLTILSTGSVGHVHVDKSTGSSWLHWHPTVVRWVGRHGRGILRNHLRVLYRLCRLLVVHNLLRRSN
jgi:hypothetical protein